MDLPLYVLDDPADEDLDVTRESDEQRQHRLRAALEMLAEVGIGVDGPFTGTVALDVPAAPRADRTSLILRRFLLVTPDEGARRFDDWVTASARVRSVGSGTWRFERWLPTDDPDIASPGRPPAPPLRRIEGRLRLWASPVAVPVVVELVPWYCSRAALELRPKDRRKQLTWLRRETYFRTSHRLLDDLRDRCER